MMIYIDIFRYAAQLDNNVYNVSDDDYNHDK